MNNIRDTEFNWKFLHMKEQEKWQHFLNAKIKKNDRDIKQIITIF